MVLLISTCLKGTNNGKKETIILSFQWGPDMNTNEILSNNPIKEAAEGPKLFFEECQKVVHLLNTSTEKTNEIQNSIQEIGNSLKSLGIRVSEASREH